MRADKVSFCRVTALVCAACLFAALTVVPSAAEPVSMSPHRIVLNAEGQSEDVQAIISMPLPSGYALADYDVRLWLDGIEVAQAISFRYCYVDQNFLAGFDRTGLQTNPDVQAMAGETVPALVAGSYTAVNLEGDVFTKYFSGTDSVEIVAPGKKG